MKLRLFFLQKENKMAKTRLFVIRHGRTIYHHTVLKAGPDNSRLQKENEGIQA